MAEGSICTITRSTGHFDPWVNDDGENLCSTVVNKEDFKVLPGDGASDPSQPPVTSNSRSDADSAEQQIVSKLSKTVNSA